MLYVGTIINMKIWWHEFIKTKEYLRIKIKTTLNCKNYGIYTVKCFNYNEFYVGQTKNSFNTRWNAHSINWELFQRQCNLKDTSEGSVLFKHYFVNKRNSLENLWIKKHKCDIYWKRDFKILDNKASLWIK